MPNALSRLVEEDRRSKLAREMSHLNSSGQGESIDTMRANAIARLKAAPGQAAQGIFTGIAGAPVDITNMALQPFGLGSDRPVGGSNYFAGLLNADTQSAPYQAGTMLPVNLNGVTHGLPLLAGMTLTRGDDMARLIREAQAQIDAENAAKDLIRYQPESHRVRNALIGLGAGGAGVAGGYYGADYLSR